jgi:hypothetical protein
MEMLMKKMKMKGMDAMAIKDGYIAKAVSYDDLVACNDKKLIKKGPYEMEYLGEEVEDEENGMED